MPGVHQRVVVHDIGQRVHEVVEDEVEAHELVGLLAAILRVDGAFVLADAMGRRQDQRARARRRIVDGHILCALGHKDVGDDGRDGMRGEVLAVGTAVLVVVANQILEDGGEEIIFLVEGSLEREGCELRDELGAEAVALSLLDDEARDAAEESDRLALAHPHREHVDVVIRDTEERGIECSGETFLVFPVEERGYQVLGPHDCRLRRQVDERHLAVFLRHLFIGSLGVFRILEVVKFPKLMHELVVQELVEEGLGDDLVLRAVVCQTRLRAHALEPVDHSLGIREDIRPGKGCFFCHYAASLRSSMYSLAM